MKKSDLYQLIHSMTTAERKLFSEKNASRKQATFMQLYDIITSLGLKHDGEVKRALPDATFIGHLHKTKSYLYEHLMAVLLPPVKEYSLVAQLLQKMQYAELMIQRNLPDQARELLDEALLLAEQTEDHALAFRIFQLLMHVTSFSNSHIENQKKQLDLLTNWFQWRSVLDEWLKWYVARGSIQTETPLLRPDVAFPKEPPLSNKAKLIQLAANRIQIVDSGSSFREIDWEIYRQMVAGNLASIDESTYVNAIFNIGLNAKDEKHLEDMRFAIDQLEKFVPQSRKSRAKRTLHLLRLKIEYHYMAPTASYKKLTQWMNNTLAADEELMLEEDKLKIHSQMARFLLAEQQYNLALDSIHKILNAPQAQRDKPIAFRVALLYQIIAYFELKQLDVVQPLLRQHHYFIKTKKGYLKTERLVHDFIQKALSETDRKKLRTMQQQLQEKILTLKGHEDGASYLRDINWPLKSRIA
ncbi:MAG: hypothetical protein U0T84_07575 [Chitinophagales bacterium]